MNIFIAILIFQKSLIQKKNTDRPQRLIFAKQNGHVAHQPNVELSPQQSPTSPASRTTTSLNSSEPQQSDPTNGLTDTQPAHVSPEVQQRMHKLENFETSFSLVLRAMSDSLKKNEARLSASEDRDYVKREWQQVALVVDRLLLFIFMLMTVGVTLGLLLRGTITYALAIHRSQQLTSSA